MLCGGRDCQVVGFVRDDAGGTRVLYDLSASEGKLSTHPVISILAWRIRVSLDDDAVSLA